MKENDFFLPPKKKNGDVVLFMFLFFLLLPGFSIAQYKAQLNIDIKNGTLVNVFENIQKQSAYRFMYSNQDVAAIKNISVQREGVSVQEILDIVLKGRKLPFHNLESESWRCRSGWRKRLCDRGYPGTDRRSFGRCRTWT